MARSSQGAPTRVSQGGRTDVNRRLVERDDAPLFVSVIVPVWNDSVRLGGCLRALEEQTYPGHLYEVVVVDNDSTEPVGRVVASYPHARVVREMSPGSYAARNTGLAHARGEVIAFTDADCLPASDWLEKGVERLTRGTTGCAVVAGRIEIFPRSPPQPNAVERYEALVALAQREFVTKYRFGATANLFTFREVFVRAGPFLAEVKSGGDLEWGRRVMDYGYGLEYAEDVCVLHPARASLAQLYSKIVRTTGGLHDLKRLKGRAYLEFERSLAVELLPPARAIAAVLREPSAGRRRERLKVCAVVLFVRYVQAFERLRLSFPKLWKRHTTAR
jgi:glycosyltransferase involved in cell wall biosynthesis